jgi:hypothetical protein
MCDLHKILRINGLLRSLETRRASLPVRRQPGVLRKSAGDQKKSYHRQIGIFNLNTVGWLIMLGALFNLALFL